MSVGRISLLRGCPLRIGTMCISTSSQATASTPLQELAQRAPSLRCVASCQSPWLASARRTDSATSKD
jgi:hypothetical protein